MQIRQMAKIRATRRDGPADRQQGADRPERRGHDADDPPEGVAFNNETPAKSSKIPSSTVIQPQACRLPNT